MADPKKIFQMIMSGGLTAAGGAVGGPAGAAIGSGVASGINTGIDYLTDSPEETTPTADQYSSLFISGEIAKNASMMDTIGADEVSRLSQAGRDEANQKNIEANTMFRGLSPYDAAKIAQALINKSTLSRANAVERIAQYVTGSKGKVLAGAISANQSYANISKSVADDELRRKLLAKKEKAIMDEDFANTLASLSKTFSNSVLDIMPKEKAPAAVTTTTPEAGQVYNENAPAAVATTTPEAGQVYNENAPDFGSVGAGGSLIADINRDAEARLKIEEERKKLPKGAYGELLTFTQSLNDVDEWMKEYIPLTGD